MRGKGVSGVLDPERVYSTIPSANSPASRLATEAWECGGTVRAGGKGAHASTASGVQVDVDDDVTHAAGVPLNNQSYLRVASRILCISDFIILIL